jgi:membrane fusion protein (multidrug efflux system)
MATPHAAPIAMGSLFRWLGAPALIISLSAGCKAAPTIAPAPDKVEVGVVTLAAESIEQQRELPGRTAPFRVAEVRARVNGIVLGRLFKEGDEVKEGQPLYRIDPLAYQAALNSALATLARAQASAETSHQQADRSAKMLETGVASQQSYDTAAGAYKVAMADVAAGKAAVQTARINLGYTNVVAPIAGRIGRSDVTEGAYVQQSQATLMATVQQLDPIYVDLTQPSTELLRLKRQLESGQLVRSGDGAKVRLLLEDDTVYGEAGTLQFSDVTVNPSTGSITVRALFPNPKKELLPGMFVRAKLEDGTTPDALLVPQVAVRRDPQGKASVLVVGADNKVETRPVEAPQAIGDKWRVSEGLSVGDRVIVEGLQKVRPGSVVTTVPAASETAKHGPP